MCSFAAADPPDPVQLRWICERSAQGATIATAPMPAAQQEGGPRPSAAESLALLEQARACPFASRDLACGCSGIRCGLRPAGRQVGPIQTCFDCQRRYPDPAP